MMGAAVSFHDRDRRRDFTAAVIRKAAESVRSNPWAGGATLYQEVKRLFELVAGGDVDDAEVKRALGRELTEAAFDASQGMQQPKVDRKPDYRKHGAAQREREIPKILQRAQDAGFRNPRRGLRDDARGVPASRSGRPMAVVSAPTVAPAVAVVAPLVLETHRAARAAVWACAVWGPWPEPVLVWLQALGLTQRDAVAAGVRFIPGAAVRALGEEIGQRAGLWSPDSRRWHVPVAEGNPPGLWFPAYAPGGDVPERWTWRPSEPVIIGGQRVKTLQTRTTPGSDDWPFGCQALESAAAIVVVEGEKDWIAFVGAAAACDFTLQRPGGIRVVGLPGARWRPEWGRIFDGVSRVVVATHCDEAGDSVAPKVLEAAKAAGVPEILRVSPNVVPLPEGAKDWCDALAVASRDDLVSAWRPLPHCLVGWAPVGLRWPADDVLELGASRRPLVIVPDVGDALVYAGTAFGLPADDGTVMPLDVVAVGQIWAPGWAAIFDGRPGVLLATPPDASKWGAGKGAAGAARAAGVPLAVAVLEHVNGRSEATTSWAGLVTFDGLRRREVVDVWRSKLREVIR